jgi:TPP-dependent pyruvate/acetoin dehydrogenase alpha subunit
MHRCPIERMEKIILENKLQSHENLNQIRTIIRKEVEEAFSSAISSKFPVEEELFEHVYAN